MQVQNTKHMKIYKFYNIKRGCKFNQYNSSCDVSHVLLLSIKTLYEKQCITDSFGINGRKYNNNIFNIFFLSFQPFFVYVEFMSFTTMLRYKERINVAYFMLTLV